MNPEKQENIPSQTENTEISEQTENRKASDIIEESNLPKEEKDKLLQECKKDEEECLASFIGNKEKLLEETKDKLNLLVSKEYSEKSKEEVGSEGIKKAQKYLGLKETGEADEELLKELIEFQERNNLEVDGVLGDLSLKMMEEKEHLNLVPGAENINEVYEQLTSGILGEYIGKLNSKEGIKLSKESIYDDMISIINKTKDKISENNIFSGDIDNIKKNFLEPKEKGLKHIEYLLGKMFPGEKEDNKTLSILKGNFDEYKSSLIELAKKGNGKLSKEDINSLKNDEKFKELFEKNPELLGTLISMPSILKSLGEEKFGGHLDWIKNSIENQNFKVLEGKEVDKIFSLAKSGLDSLFDSGINKTPEELKKQIGELKNIKEVDKLFEKIPDLENIFSEMLPNIIKTTDKEVFGKSLDKFYLSVKDDILNYSIENPNITKDDLYNSKLNIINKFSLFLGEIINKESADTFSKELGKLDFIKNNEKFSSMVALVNDPAISEKDKLNLSEKLIQILGGLTNKNIKKEELKKHISSFLSFIEDLSGKVPDEKLIDLIKKFYGTESEQKLNIDHWEGIKVYLSSESVRDVFHEYVKDNKTPEEFILYLIKNGKINGLLDGIGWKITETLRNVVNINFKKTIKEVRKELLDDSKKINKDGENKTNEDETTETKKSKKEIIEGILIGKIQSKFEKSLYSLVNEKVNSNEDNNLTKDKLIFLSIENLKEFIGKGANTDLLVEYSKELGVKIENEKDVENVKQIINNILENPDLKGVVGKIVLNLENNLKGSKNISVELKKIIDKAKKSKGISLLNEENKGKIRNITLNEIFDNVLGNEENLDTTIRLLRDKIGLNKDLKSEDVKELILTLKQHISKDDIDNLLEKYPKLKSLDFEDINTSDIILELYDKGVENKPGLINSLLDKDLITKLNTNKADSKSSFEKSDINLVTDGIYTTLEGSNKRDLGKTVNKILEKSGLKQLSETKIFGREMGDNIVSILSALKKEDFRAILESNNENINKLKSGKISDTERAKILTQIGTDILEKLDMTKISTEIKKGKLLDNEALIVGVLPELQKALKEDKQQIDDLASKSIDIYNRYFKQGKMISYDSTEAQNIGQYGEEVFDILKSVMNKIPDGYLEENLKSSSGESSKEMEDFIDGLTDSFLGNNKLFILGELFSGIFEGEFNTGKSIEEYFKGNNKEDFGDTVKSYFVKLNNPNLNFSEKSKKREVTGIEILDDVD